jgi:carboxypeptidase Taq
MSTSLKNLLQKYYQHLALFKAFTTALGLMSWDTETYMPKQAAGDRGQTQSLLAGHIHHLSTDAEFVNLVNSLMDRGDKLSPIDQRSIYLTKRSLDQSIKLPKKFVEEMTEALVASHQAWLQAKEQNQFEIFTPHLEKVIKFRQQYAHYIDPSQDPYDVHLDTYEEGLTTKQLAPLFSELRAGLVKLLPQILDKQSKAKQQHVDILNQYPLPRYKLEPFLRELCSQIGFQFSRGQMAHVEHPFEINISANDVRINTHFDDYHSSFTITGVIHELGHGLYEQNIGTEYLHTEMAGGASLGIHESQSRLLENIIGRSPEFWQFCWPKLQALFPELSKHTASEVVAGLSFVQPSLIRTEADEVTYNLHIILRMELEMAMMRGELAVSDLPEAWNTKMQQLLGIKPTDHRTGVLQDVHWSWGNIGYFPTYTLGNMNAAQLWQSFVKATPNWRAEIAAGNFESYFHWFKQNVWQHGAFYQPQQLLKKVTGESTNPQHLLKYLESKYL